MTEIAYVQIDVSYDGYENENVSKYSIGSVSTRMVMRLV